MDNAIGLYTPANDVTRYGLTASAVRTAPVMLPPIEEQCRISAVFYAVDMEIEYLKMQEAALVVQKRGLMQNLLTGEIRV